MVMNLHALRSVVATTVLLATVTLGSSLAQAAATATASSDAGLPGGTVAPTLDVGFNPDLALFAFDLAMQFDANVLTWQESSSTLTLNDITYSFSDVAALTSAGIGFGLDLSATPTLIISAIPDSELALASINFKPTFQINASALPGVSAVTFSGTFANQDLIEFGIENVSAQISVVPEPTTWLLLLAGLGLVGAAASRRQAA